MGAQALEQRRGLVLPRLHLQRGQRLAQRREDQRQQVGRQRRDDAEPEAPGQRVAQVARHGEHRVGLRHRGAGMSDQLLTGGSRRHRLARALEQRHAKQLLELADLHGKRRLADTARLGGTAEMLMLGHGQQVAEVPEVHWVSLALVIDGVYHIFRNMELPFIVGMPQEKGTPNHPMEQRQDPTHLRRASGARIAGNQTGLSVGPRDPEVLPVWLIHRAG